MSYKDTTAKSNFNPVVGHQRVGKIEVATPRRFVFIY